MKAEAAILMSYSVTGSWFSKGEVFPRPKKAVQQRSMKDFMYHLRSKAELKIPHCEFQGPLLKGKFSSGIEGALAST